VRAYQRCDDFDDAALIRAHISSETSAYEAGKADAVAKVVALEAEMARLEALVIGFYDLLTGPDEQGAYIHQRQLCEAAMPIKVRAVVHQVMGKDDGKS
jgi:hypothetical protein